MCQKVYAEFRCASYHEGLNEPRDRLKHIKDCDKFRRSEWCGEWRSNRDYREDDRDHDCPECGGERPPKPSRSNRSKSGWTAHNAHAKPDGDPPSGCEECAGDLLHYKARSSLGAVLDRAALGCDTSIILLEVLKHLDASKPDKIFNWERRHFPRNRDEPMYFENHRDLRIYRRPPVGPLDIDMTLYDDYTLFTLPLGGTPWFDFEPGVLIQADPFAHSCIEQARLWLYDCIHGHKTCEPSEPWSLPTRVIDVGRGPCGDSPYLYVSNGECLPYMTLSYRWGTNMDFFTTTQNFERLQKSIDVDSMPSMFEQAMHITRALGVRYLWIDALCIVQDDAEDWKRESGRMSSIYGFSTLTLSATSSSSPSEGLSPIRQEASLVCQHIDVQGVPYDIYIRNSISHAFLHAVHGFSSQNYTTFSRGWCLQERLLSPRVLHFTHQEMVWDCRSGCACECGESDSRLGKTDLFRFNALTMASRSLTASVETNLLSHWMHILTLFSKTELTHDKDLLPAISGIAEVIFNMTGWQYMAGLWNQHLVRQLMWRRYYTRSSDGILHFGRSTSEYTAPSFSPLSKVGAISYSDPHNPHDVEIVEAEAVPLASNPLGSVISGYIKIKAPVHAIRVISAGSGGEKTPEIEGINGSGKRCQLGWVPDTDEYVERLVPDEQLLFVFLAGTFGLLLRPHESDARVVYRIGVCSPISPLRTGPAPIRTLTIK